MITEQETEKARVNWLKASNKLKFKIFTPYSFYFKGIKKEVFAFLPNYGSSNGIIVELTSSPEYEIDKEIIEWAKANNCCYSFVNIENCLYYSEFFFKETIEDWMKYE